MTAGDDSLQALARDLEAAGQPEFAARLSVLLEHSPFILPQIAVSPPVPEPTYPELAEVAQNAPAEGET